MGREERLRRFDVGVIPGPTRRRTLRGLIYDAYWGTPPEAREDSLSFLIPPNLGKIQSQDFKLIERTVYKCRLANKRPEAQEFMCFMSLNNTEGLTQVHLFFSRHAYNAYFVKNCLKNRDQDPKELDRKELEMIVEGSQS